MNIQFRHAEFFGVAAHEEQCPKDGLPEIVIAGRSNVGKSSLINALVDQRKIARISQTPGKTRHVIFFKVDQAFYLVDLPGYGYAAVSREEQARFSHMADTYLCGNRPIALILFLLDIRIDPTELDHQMLYWLKASGLPFRVVLTKADKLSRSKALNRRFEIARAFNLDSNELIIYYEKNKTGIDELRTMIAEAIQKRKA